MSWTQSLTSDGCEIRHARPTKTLLRSVKGSATNIWMPVGNAIGKSWCSPSIGSSLSSSSSWLISGDDRPAAMTSLPSCPFRSSRASSPAFSLLSLSSYHAKQRSRTFWRPSKTQTVSWVHSIPLFEIYVLKIDPKRAESALNAPIYLESSWSCGGEVLG